MIRYPISRAELEALIEAESPGWLARAALRTAEFRSRGRYEEVTSIWSDVKSVYMRLQGGSKCAYCERKLESENYGRIEQDVEHFRPKKRVRFWSDETLVQQGIPFTAVPTGDRGYYLLPYHPFNYAAACKPCNSTLKANYFPIAGTYALDADNPDQAHGERPYLIYPVGDVDDAPEALIEFYGLMPRHVAASGHDRNRALVTIALFRLGDEDGRKNLFRERAQLIHALFGQLEEAIKSRSDKKKNDAREVVEAYTRSTSPHVNCLRSFKSFMSVILPMRALLAILFAHLSRLLLD